MILFLLAFLLIYGGFHLHFFVRIRSALVMGGGAGTVLAVLLLIGLTAPVMIRIAEERACDFLARFLSVIGYYWMAFLLLFCVISLLVT